MKFIFPQNYNFKNKLFGFIDYTTVLFNIFWCVFIFLILYFFCPNLNISIFLFILFCFPFFLLSITGLNGENLFYIICYLIKFLFRQKILLFSKKN